MIEFKYWDILLVDFNPTKWAEISKIRPCIVISNNIINSYDRLFVAIPITSNINKILKFHVFVKKSKMNWLTNDSKIVSNQIRSLDKNRIVKKLWKLESDLIKELEKSILFIINQGLL